MITRIIDAKEGLSEENALIAAELIKGGFLVAFPTETVYGLGGSALNAAVAAAIFAVKGRPADNPLIVHLADMDQLSAVALASPLAYTLFERFAPGPLTLVLPKKEAVPYAVSGGLDTVGVRFPAFPQAQAFLKACLLPIAAPSANLSGRPSPTRCQHVEADLGGRIPLIIDGGFCPVGLESTVLDISGDIPCLLREGAVTEEDLLPFCKRIRRPASADAQSPKAPGMKYTHYAPKGKVIPLEGEACLQFYRENQARGQCLLLLTAETAGAAEIPYSDTLILGARTDLESIARNLFAAFRLADERGADFVIVETVEESGLGAAIMNRVNKAAGI